MSADRLNAIDSDESIEWGEGWNDPAPFGLPERCRYCQAPEGEPCDPDCPAPLDDEGSS